MSSFILQIIVGKFLIIIDMIYKQTIFILLGILVFNSYQLVPNRQSDTIRSIIDMHLSPDQIFYAAFNSTHVGIYDAHTGRQLLMLYPATSPVSITFFSNSHKFALAEASGYLTVYKIQLQNQQYGLTQIKKLNSIELSNKTNILSICYTAQSSYLVVLYDDGSLLAWALGGLIAQGTYDGHGRKLACSPSSPFQFAVGTNAVPNTTAQLLIFQINQQTLQINKKNITIAIDQFSALNYITYNQAGNQIYVVGNSGEISAYKAPQYQRTIFYQGIGIISKFLISKSEKEFAFVNSTHASYVEITPLLRQVVTEYATTSQTFALAWSGARLIYADETNKANFLDKCKEGSFYNQYLGKCETCSSQCVLCGGNGLYCYQCSLTYYFSDLRCLKCGDRCQQCVNNQECLNCQNPFKLLENKKCGCDNGYFIQENSCVRGMEFWLFGLVTGGAVLVLFLLAAVNILIMRKKQAQKYLLADEE